MGSERGGEPRNFFLLDSQVLRFPRTDEDWRHLVDARRGELRRFLTWAAACEGDPSTSLRLEHRSDLQRVKEVLPRFTSLWWGVVVYTCFDSVTGTCAVAGDFRQPLSPADADRLLSHMNLPRGAVLGHRTQRGHAGAKRALLEACRRQADFRDILLEMDGFDDRYRALRGLRAPEWGRTTCFDLLVRAGTLGAGDEHYRPDRAYLAESTGPKGGFAAVWGIAVTPENAELCEELLRGWNTRWDAIAEHLGVKWRGAPYGPADFENALCIYQEREGPTRAPKLVRC